jgi:signal peptidase I
LAVLGFHSFIAKPFYIPSESMMPALLKGDRLVVSKYAYGWSFVSPTIPNPAAIFRTVVLRGPAEPWGVTLPFMKGRLFGRMPERGDVVIVTPPGENEDYIKRVIGLPGDTIEVRGGRLIINGKPVKSVSRPPAMIPVDANVPCGIQFSGFEVAGPGGKAYCRLPIVRETLPNGVTYDTIDLGESPGDDFGPVKVTPDHLFLMGDNRDRSADSRFSLGPPENGLGGPVPWENIGGRAEFITFSLDGTAQTLNPLSWIQSLRSGRAGDSLRAHKE